MYYKELCGFSISCEKQQMLEQCVRKGRSDNPRMYCFTCHLQVIYSIHAIHSGQHCQSSALENLLGESHSKPVIKQYIELVPSLLLWCNREELVPLPVLTLN